MYVNTIGRLIVFATKKQCWSCPANNLYHKNKSIHWSDAMFVTTRLIGQFVLKWGKKSLYILHRISFISNNSSIGNHKDKYFSCFSQDCHVSLCKQPAGFSADGLTADTDEIQQMFIYSRISSVRISVRGLKNLFIVSFTNSLLFAAKFFHDYTFFFMYGMSNCHLSIVNRNKIRPAGIPQTVIAHTVPYTWSQVRILPMLAHVQVHISKID